MLWTMGILLYLLIAQEVLWHISNFDDEDDTSGMSFLHVLYSLFWVVPLTCLFVWNVIVIFWSGAVALLIFIKELLCGK